MTETRGTYEVEGRLRRETRLPFVDPHYSPPTQDEIRTALRLGGLTGSKAGDLLGVSGRTIRKWTGGDQAIPYSAWRLLLQTIGEAIEAADELKD